MARLKDYEDMKKREKEKNTQLEKMRVVNEALDRQRSDMAARAQQ